jgi:NAD-reducing hydrogenase small subunit
MTAGEATAAGASGPPPGRRPRLATVWLAGCSGCHMAFLDLDEWLLQLAEIAEIVYSPLASDIKIYPEAVDVCLVEGAVANSDNLAMARILRRRTRVVVAFGDCAISANVSGLRNLCGDGAAGLGSAAAVLGRSYRELADSGALQPGATALEGGGLPRLLEPVLPLHAVIPVDLWLPGCPPPVARIRLVLEALLRGEGPLLEGPEGLRFG